MRRRPFNRGQMNRAVRALRADLAAKDRAPALETAALAERVAGSARIAALYDRETLWDRQINVALRKEADMVLQTWLDEQRPHVAKRVRAALDAKKGELIGRLVEQVADGLTHLRVDWSGR